MIRRMWERFKLWGAIWLITMGAFGLLLVISEKTKPLRADPQPAAICALDEDTVTADGTQLWPGGFAAPCKWFKKEQDV